MKEKTPLRRFIGENRIRLAKAILVELGANVCTVLLTFFLAQSIAAVVGFQSFKARILGFGGVGPWIRVGGAAGLAVLRLALDLFRFRMRATLSEDFAFQLRTLLFSRYINYKSKSDVRIGVALLRFSGDMGDSRQLLSLGILQASADVTLVVAGLTLIWVLDLKLGLAFMVALILCYFAIHRIFGRLPQRVRLSHNTKASLLAYVSGALSNIDSLRAFNRESRACRQFERKARKVRDANVDLQKINGDIRAGAQFISYI